MYIDLWQNAINMVLQEPKHKDIIFSKSILQKIPSYFKPRIGLLFNGVIGHYSTTLTDDRSIHIKEYDKYYKIHWDQKDANKEPLQHLIYDAPHWLIAGGVVLDLAFNKGRITKSIIKFLVG